MLGIVVPNRTLESTILVLVTPDSLHHLADANIAQVAYMPPIPTLNHCYITYLCVSKHEVHEFPRISDSISTLSTARQASKTQDTVLLIHPDLIRIVNIDYTYSEHTTMTAIQSQPPDLTKLHKLDSPTIPTKLDTSTAPAASSQSYRSQLIRHGYVVIPKLLPPHLLLASQASCKYLVTNTRSGTYWPHVRTVPKQFPPWPKYISPDQKLNIWGIQHLLHPSLSGLRDVFAEVYFSEQILSPVRDILSTDTFTPTSSDLVMELFNLLISPETDFELIWHRDDIKSDLSGEEELKQIDSRAPGGRQLHAQYNIALFEDESLIVVPGSHRRARTEEEREAGKYDKLSGEVRVKLEPGDAVFYDSNIWHRGVYRGIDVKEEMGRMTLHGSVGLKGFGEERSRQVLQHGVGEWIEADGGGLENIHDEQKKEVADVMRRNLIEMGKGRGNVGFSLDG